MESERIIKWLFFLVFLPAGCLFVYAGARSAGTWFVLSTLVLFLLGAIYVAGCVIFYFAPYLRRFRFVPFKKKRCHQLFALVAANSLAANIVGRYRLPKEYARLTCTDSIVITRNENDLVTVFFQTIKGYIPDQIYCVGYLICNRPLEGTDTFSFKDDPNRNLIEIDSSDPQRKPDIGDSAGFDFGKAEKLSLSELTDNLCRFRWWSHDAFVISKHINPCIYYCYRDDTYRERMFGLYIKARSM